jgi:ecotin
MDRPVGPGEASAAAIVRPRSREVISALPSIFGILILSILLACPLVGTAQTQQDACRELKAFPPAGEGMTRFVITLPPQADEDLLKVQLLIGKTVKLDPQNRYFFGGKLEQVTIPGWGYDRYVLKNLGPMAGTLMAVDPNIPKVDRFIALGGEPELLRYNSRLPLVVYVPNGVEVSYRIWRGDGKAKAIPEG